MNIQCTEVGVTYFHVDKLSPLTDGCHRRKYLCVDLRDGYKQESYIDIYGWSTDINNKFLKLLQYWNRTSNWAYAPLQSEEL